MSTSIADYMAPVAALILVVLLAWIGLSALLMADIETRVARHFDQLLKGDVLIRSQRSDTTADR